MKRTFPGYYRPDFAALWKEAIFAFDANVLLGVYRYTPKTRDNLLAVLRGLGDRIWLPHQAGLEFHRNRLAVISSQVASIDAVGKTVAASLGDLGRHPFVSPDGATKLKTIAAQVEAVVKHAKAEREKDSSKDDTLRDALTQLFEGKVGSKYPPEEQAKREKEAEDRISQSRPPGYRDAGKKDARQFGDVILGLQLKDHAKTTKEPIIFVTDDRKEDWWLIHEGKTICPRPELIDEFAEDVKVSFYMYPSDQFLEHAQDFLGLKDKAAVDEVRKVGEEALAYALDFDEQAAVRSALASWIKGSAEGYRAYVEARPEPGFRPVLITRGRLCAALAAVHSAQRLAAGGPAADVPALIKHAVGLSERAATRVLQILLERGLLELVGTSGRLTESGLSEFGRCLNKGGTVLRRKE